MNHTLPAQGTLPSMGDMLDIWSPPKIVKRSASMQQIQGLSRFRHLDFVSEYSSQPQDYSKPRQTASNGGTFSKAGAEKVRLAASRGVSSPSLKRHLEDRSISYQRANNRTDNRKKFSTKQTAASTIARHKKMQQHVQTLGKQRDGEEEQKTTEEEKPYINNFKKIEMARELARERVLKRGGYFNQPRYKASQNLVPFGVGKANDSHIAKMFKVKEEDDETLYRDKVHFFLNLNSRSTDKTLARDKKMWKNAKGLHHDIRSRSLGIDRRDPKKDYFDHNKALEILRVPRDPYRFVKQANQITYGSAFKSTTARLLADTIDFSGPGPNLNTTTPFKEYRPGHASESFLATSRATYRGNPIR